MEELLNYFKKFMGFRVEEALPQSTELTPDENEFLAMTMLGMDDELDEEYQKRSWDVDDLPDRKNEKPRKRSNVDIDIDAIRDVMHRW